ncbi:MAG: tRNA (guanosine(37)-N1)-methyltransferase TrmD [Gammaproteobacteria bacterium]|nr:MAG: tRNA (guanosine(37)-N1)-methyltransferase TrmD [Gammaproteobacteria bacterium]
MNKQQRIDVITLFPEMINGVFAEGVTGRAIHKQILALHTLNPRQFADDVHQSVDDRPYGGGPGMVMNCQVIEQSLAHIDRQYGRGYRVYLTPQGKTLNHDLVQQLSHKEHLVLLCGRYEGIDERVIEEQIDLECSLGDFVLSGGEPAAIALIDAIARLLPGTLGHKDSADNDSFATGLLDHPHYTRPESVNGKTVPDVLLSGNHEAIADYRLQQALGNSWLKRPDLFARKALSEAELCLLNDFLKQYRN